MRKQLLYKENRRFLAKTIVTKEHIEKSKIKYPDFRENPDIFYEKICIAPDSGDFSAKKPLKADIFYKKISSAPIDR